MRRALGEALVKLDPRTMIRNPVMFTVEIGSVVTTVEFAGRPDLFVGLVADETPEGRSIAELAGNGQAPIGERIAG